MAIVEAASVGLLVVSTRVGGVPEVNIAAAPGGGGVCACCCFRGRGVSNDLCPSSKRNPAQHNMTQYSCTWPSTGDLCQPAGGVNAHGRSAGGDSPAAAPQGGGGLRMLLH